MGGGLRLSSRKAYSNARLLNACRVIYLVRLVFGQHSVIEAVDNYGEAVVTAIAVPMQIEKIMIGKRTCELMAS